MNKFYLKINLLIVNNQKLIFIIFLYIICILTLDTFNIFYIEKETNIYMYWLLTLSIDLLNCVFFVKIHDTFLNKSGKINLRLSIGKKEFIYFAICIELFLFMLIIVSLMNAFILMMPLNWLDSFIDLTIIYVIIFLPSFLFISRLILRLPAIAINEDKGFIGSWKISHYNYYQFSILFCLSCVIIGINFLMSMQKTVLLYLLLDFIKLLLCSSFIIFISNLYKIKKRK